jgi:hypothetical protein
MAFAAQAAWLFSASHAWRKSTAEMKVPNTDIVKSVNSQTTYALQYM